MPLFLTIANLLLPLLYLSTAVLYAFAFFQGHPKALHAAPLALRTTVVFHFAALAAAAFRFGQFPAATVSQALSGVAFAVAAVYAFVEWHGKERATGFCMVSLVFLFQLLASALVRPNPPDRAIFHDPLFGLHVSLALLGYAAFVVAAAYGFLFLQLYDDLKHGRFSSFFGKLPPLATLERMLVGALTTGVISLTGAVATGIIWAHRLYHEAWVGDPKILFTLAIWVLYTAALLLRRLRRWQGRQMAWVALTGLLAILFSLVAINVFFTDFHGFL